MSTPHDEPERDAWLSAALHHAPDANAAPPADVSDTILRAARNAVKTPVAVPAAAAAQAPRANALTRWWSWLARPPIAAGFASVMVAVLVGVMWWDKPLNETLPPRAEAPAVATGPSATSATPASEPPAARADAPAPSAAPAPAAPPPTAPQSAKKAARDKVPAADNADTAARGQVEAERRAPVAASPAPPSDSRARSPENEAAKPAADAAPAPAAAPAPFADRAPMRAAAMASAPSDDTAMQRRERTSATPLGTPIERWSWQRDGAVQPMTPAVQRWLADLDRSARWRPTDSAVPSDALTLQLNRDGARAALIQLGDDAVWLTTAGAPPLIATLSPAALAALKSALIAATP